MLRRTFLISLLGFAGCAKKRKQTLPEIVDVLPIPPNKSLWIKGQPNPNRVVVYLDTRPIVTQVKVCRNGICRLENRSSPNQATVALRASLLSLQEKGWKVGGDESQHIQIIDLCEAHHAVKYLEGQGVITKSCPNMTAVWVSKFYYDQNLTCEPKTSSNVGKSQMPYGGKTYPKQTSHHKGVVGESWQDYYNHLIHSPNHRELWGYENKLRHHSLESLKRIHDASHFGRVQLDLVFIENGLSVV